MINENEKMNFEDLSFDDLDQHIMEQLVFEEDAMSPVIRGHLFVEKILRTLISQNMENAETFFRSNRSFSLINDIAFGMALIDVKYYSAYKSLNKIRNNYAHKHNHVLDVAELSRMKFDWEDIQHQAFVVACSKGAGEAAKVATIFLCWKTIHLIKKP